MTAEVPPFSVLMAVYGGDDPHQFTAALRSVTDQQSLRPAEVVLVQDGPVPAPLAEAVAGAIEAASVPVHLVRLPENQGLAAALTAGLEAVSHDFVARMDADDLSLPERFARQIPYLAADRDLVGSAITEFGDDDEVARTRPAPLGADAIAAQARLRSPFHHPSVVFRASAVAAAGGYQDLDLMEDYWLWARMLQAGARVDNLPEPLVMYRVGAGAYARRGGWSLLRSELRLQAAFARIGFVSRGQRWRNVLVRGVYRLVPESVRRVAYRAIFARGRETAE